MGLGPEGVPGQPDSSWLGKRKGKTLLHSGRLFTQRSAEGGRPARFQMCQKTGQERVKEPR